MMGRDRVIDPMTGDYVSDGRGGRVTTTGPATKCHHQLRTARGTWPGDHEAGGDFHLLERKLTDAEFNRAVDMTRAALERLVNAGAIRDLHTELGQDQAGRPAIQWFAIDTQSGDELAGTEVIPWGA